jgi:hypothetical protein
MPLPFHNAAAANAHFPPTADILIRYRVPNFDQNLGKIRSYMSYLTGVMPLGQKPIGPLVVPR